jgi:hypothetical protein
LPLAGNEVKQTAFDDRTVMASTPSSDITAVLEAFENKLMIVGSNLEDFNGIRLEAVVMQFMAYATSEEARNILSARVI